MNMTEYLEQHGMDDDYDLDTPSNEDICTGDCSDCPNGDEDGECKR